MVIQQQHERQTTMRTSGQVQREAEGGEGRVPTLRPEEAEAILCFVNECPTLGLPIHQASCYSSPGDETASGHVRWVYAWQWCEETGDKEMVLYQDFLSFARFLFDVLGEQLGGKSTGGLGGGGRIAAASLPASHLPILLNALWQRMSVLPVVGGEDERESGQSIQEQEQVVRIPA